MTERWWTIAVDGFSAQDFFAPTAAKARYMAFKAIREAGYYQGSDAFWRFLVASRVYPSVTTTGDPRTPEFGVAA